MASVEQKLVEALEQRRPCNFSAGTSVDDLEKSSEWGPDRTIEAALLRKILIGATGSDGLADQPLEIIGALIKGKVDLRAATVKRPVAFDRCVFSDSIDCRDARMSSTSFQKCRVLGIDARYAEFDGSLLLRDSDLNGPLDLVSASVNRDIDLRKSRLGVKSRIIADRVNVGGSVYFREGFTTEAQISMEGAQITSMLDGIEGRFRNDNGVAVMLNAAKIGGFAVFTSAELRAKTGPVLTAEGAQIGGRLSFDRATVEGTLLLRSLVVGANVNLGGAKFTSVDGPALNLERAKIGGDVFLTPTDETANTIEGSVNLRSASIDGSLQFRKASIKKPNFPVNAPVAVTADGMRVGGQLTFDRVTAEGTLMLRNVIVGTNLNLGGAKLTSIELPALNLERAKIGGDVFMTPTEGERSTIKGSIVLWNASIDGAFQFRDAVIDGANFPKNAPAAFVADGMRVGGFVTFERSTVDGTVVLRGSVIGANLNLNAAKLTSTNGPAINMQRAKIGGDLVMMPSEGERNAVTGSVILWNASIAGAVQIREASIKGANYPVATPAAIAAEGMQIGDFLSFIRSDVQGRVLLQDVQIRRIANFSGTTIDNAGALALDLERSKIGGDLFIRPERTAGASPEICPAKIRGGVIMTATAIAGSVHIMDALENGDQSVSFIRLNVAGAFVLEKFQWRQGRLSFANAKVSFFNDGDTTWPDRPGSLVLNGFDYGLLSGNAPTSWSKRLDWLKGSEPKRPTWRQRLKWLTSHESTRDAEVEFNPQPFMTLVGVLRRAGHDRDAKMIAISRHREARKYLGLCTPSWLGNILMQVTCGYGYRPWLAALWLAAFIGFGTWMFKLPSNELVMLKDSAALKSANAYPEFDPLLYSADVLLPVVNLRQKDYWAPKSDTKARLYLPFHILAGWFFTTLFVVGVTGLIRRE
jgi:uncharacterized protein YjbI with pentapeptide repeats